MDEVMRARRSVLKRALPSRVAVPVSTPECLEWRSSDAYAVESRGFYAEWKPAVAAEAPVRKRRKQRHTLVTIQKKPTRFVTNWTPELDKNLRKCLRKFGWGAWLQMERSGKFPDGYNRKVISRRVKSLGYTKEMFVKD